MPLQNALLVRTGSFLLSRREQIVALTARLKIPAIYPFRDVAGVGRLISYGTNIPNTYRQAGIYCGRILRGDKPSELPVVQPKLLINLKTAHLLSVGVPATLHARSDAVIE
jgi:putative tryptophan/tyrosine transport system substrate-binding protein